MFGSTSGSSSRSSLQTPKKILPKSVHITLFRSTFIFFIISLFLTGSRRLNHMLRRERYLIFLTTSGIIMLPCCPFGKSVTLIKRREAFSVNYYFVEETPDDNYSCMKLNVLSIVFFSLTKLPGFKYSIRLRENIPRWLRVGDM